MTLVNPLPSDNYTGPNQIQVWKDNFFGTFMFYPVPSDTSWILTASATTVSGGNPVTLTATVTPDAQIPYAPTGTVSFYDGCQLLGTAALNPATGSASITTPISTTGNNTILAVYSGDTNFYHNDAAPLTIVVNP